MPKQSSMPLASGTMKHENGAVILERSEESQGGECVTLLLSFSIPDIKIVYALIPFHEILLRHDNS